MNDMNLVVMTGRLGQDPEIRESNGVKYANFSIAVSQQWKDKQTGEKKEQTEWIQCSARQHTAGYIEKYISKGDRVLIEGRLSIQKWQDATGASKQSAVVKVSSVQGLTIKPRTEQTTKPDLSYEDEQAKGEAFFDDDIPF